MKKLFYSPCLSSVIIVLLILSSCSGGDRDVFRIMPETTSAVVTFNPGNLMEKGKLGELAFIQNATGENAILEKFFTRPDETGINMDAYSAFFVFSKTPSYGCLVMPVGDKAKFKSFLADIQKEVGIPFQEGTIGSYESVRVKNVVIAFNKSIAFMLSSMQNAWNDAGETDSIALKLTKTSRSESLLSDKDFNKFIVRQRDINAWMTSTNLADLAGAGDLGNMMDLFGSLKNNYGHVFIDFQPGIMTLTSNLRPNATMEETIQKYNFLDQNAGKDLLKYLPLKDAFLVGNTRVDPEKLLDLMEFINKRAGNRLGEIEREFGLDENDLRKAFAGEIAFSVNGVKKSPSTKESEIYGDSSFEKTTPVFMAVVKLRNEKAWTALTNKLKEESGIAEQDGYYSLEGYLAPVFIAEKDKNIIISNSKSHISEIASEGQLTENMLAAPFADILTKDPICLFVNLDTRTYSPEMHEYIDENIGRGVAKGIDSFGKTLKSLSVTANLEEWEFRLELKEDTENSLYALLKNVNEN